MKSKNTRNFEAGIVSTNLDLVDAVMKQYDEVWIGQFCKACKRRDYCSDPIL